MWPSTAQPRVCSERSLCSTQSWLIPQRVAAAQALGRGSRRRPHRYLGVVSSPTYDSNVRAPSKRPGGDSSAVKGCKANGAEEHSPGEGSYQSTSLDALARALAPLALTPDQRRQARDASSTLMQAISRLPLASAVGRQLASTAGDVSSVDERPSLAVAALLLPTLSWQWLSVADLEGWIDRGVAHLLREALLVQKAAGDANASVSELVGWCLDNCSAPAATLAALWGQQQGPSLPPRCRSFYSLLLHRLHLDTSSHDRDVSSSRQSGGVWEAVGALHGRQHGLGMLAGSAVVLCGSVTRTALPASSLGRPTTEEGDGEEDDEAQEERQAGDVQDTALGEDSSGEEGPILGQGPLSSPCDPHDPHDPDLVVVGALPPAAQLQLAGSTQHKQLSRQEQEQMEGRPRMPYSNGVNRDGAVKNGGGPAQAAVAARIGTAAAVSSGDSGSSSSSGLQQPSEEGVRQRTEDPDWDASLGLLDSRGDEAPGLNGDGSAERSLGTAAAARRPSESLMQRPSRGASVELDASDDEFSGGSPAAEGSSQSDETPGGSMQYVPMRLVPTGRFPLRNLYGEPFPSGVAVPDTGPLVISNDSRVFPGSEAVLSDYGTPAYDKLAMRLEYITDRSDNTVSLQLFNISRVVRKRTNNCLMYVNGQAVNVGDPGVALSPDDEVWFGNATFSFRLEAEQGPPSAVTEALERFCRGPWEEEEAVAAAGGTASSDPLQDGEAEPTLVEPAAHPSAALPAAAAASNGKGPAAAAVLEQPSVSGSSILGSGLDMAQLSNLSRHDPRRAEAELRRLVLGTPSDAALWLIWAQMAARGVRPGTQAKARLLFRAAVAAARRMDVIPPPPPALQAAARRAAGRRAGGSARRNRGGGSDIDDIEEERLSDGSVSDSDMYGSGWTAAAGAATAAGTVSSSSQQQSPAMVRRRHNWLLVQALGNWGKHEWRLRMYGSARHLFRAALDEAARHPDGIAGGGGAAIMHYWASQELDALNVRNARIVVAEALRKCPADVALYNLAASVELEAGSLELAKTYCQRAYALDRTDKQLFLVWPRVEAALGDRDKARLLYERALDMHPMNTKIINLYARFEAEEGSYREAAELFDRALAIDPLSPVMGVHNRADWASLEADLGNTRLARYLLEGGLAAHPRAPPLLVTLAKVERLEGRYEAALALIRTAQAVAGPFNAAVMTERSQVLRAMGEKEMAANLSRHVSAVRALNRMKQQGYWGSEAWRAFIEGTRSPEQQALVAAARQRRQALGWMPTERGGKPQPTGQAGDGRRRATPDAQLWMQMQGLQRQQAEVRRLEAARAAQMRAEAAGEAAGLGPQGVGSGSMSSGDEEYYEEGAVGVPSLDAVRRPMPGDEDGDEEGGYEA